MDALITITGWVGGDVEHRIHPNFTTANFRIACTPRIQRQGVWTDAPTTWIRVDCYRALADHVSLSLRKGDAVVVSGKLRTQVWQGKDDNQEHERLVLEATTVGHDLTKGTAVFAKAQRGTADPSTGVPDSGDPASRPDQTEVSDPAEDELTGAEVAA